MSHARSFIRLAAIVTLVIAVSGVGAWWYSHTSLASPRESKRARKPEPLHEVRPPSEQKGDNARYMPDHSRDVHDPCSEKEAEASKQRYDLWDGYWFVIKRERQEGTQACSGALMDPTGHAIWETGAVSAVNVEDVTGQDINGDGQPELVLTLNHGFPGADIDSVIVLSVSPRPEVLAKVDAVQAGFGSDDSGRIIFKTMSIFPGMAGLGGAETPAAWQAYRLQSKVLEDITDKYCKELIQAMDDPERPGNDAIARYLHPERFQRDSGKQYDVSRTGAVTLLAQSIYCHDQEMERQILETMLPPDDRQPLRDEVHRRLGQ